MDSLSNLVRVLAPQGSLELHCRFAGGWLVDHGPALPGHLPYHVVLAGCGRVGIGARELDLLPGDIVLFPHGAAHSVRSLGLGNCEPPALSTPPERHFNGAVTEVFHPDAGKPLETLDLLCGNFVLGTPGGLLLRTLPEVVCIHTAGRADCAWLHSLTAMMRTEASAALPGTAAVIGQLSTALFTVLLRALMVDGGVTQGLLALLADARLCKAVDAVLAAPADTWTVATLAERCHMARATFAKVQAKLKEAEAAARDAADKARKASAYAALWLFVSLLIGAFAASWAATFGGRQRDFEYPTNFGRT